MLVRNFSVLVLGILILSSNINAQEAKTNESLSVALTEYEKQQKILQQFKPLIKPRNYRDLVVYKDRTPGALNLNRLPELEEAILPERAPNIRLIPYLLKSFAHPAYEARHNAINYFIAVNCEGPRSFDDCSTVPHNNFLGRKVYVKFIQSNDKAFNLVKGMRVGQRFSEVKSLFSGDAEIHGDGECLQTSSGWLACFDASKLAVSKKRLQMMPAQDSRLLRFLLIKGKAY